MEATGTALSKDRPIDGLSLNNHLVNGGKKESRSKNSGLALPLITAMLRVPIQLFAKGIIN